MTQKRGPHDIGGLPAGPVNTSHYNEADWQRQTTVLGMALGPGRRGLVRVDERRRASEDLGDDYDRLGYFDRSVQASANLLIEKGVLTQSEIDRRMAEIKARRQTSA